MEPKTAGPTRMPQKLTRVSHWSLSGRPSARVCPTAMLLKAPSLGTLPPLRVRPVAKLLHQRSLTTFPLVTSTDPLQLMNRPVYYLHTNMPPSPEGRSDRGVSEARSDVFQWWTSIISHAFHLCLDLLEALGAARAIARAANRAQVRNLI